MLKAREAHIKNVTETAKSTLSKISEDTVLYEDMLQKLMIQATFQLLEDTAFVMCREQDVTMVEVC